MRNIGTYRMQVFDRRTTGMHWQRHKGGAQHHRVAERLGKRLEVAVALGADPVLTYCATAPMPEGLDELMLAGVHRQASASSSSSAGRSISRCRPTRRSCSRATSSRASGGAKGRSAITRASTRSPTTFRCSTSRASRCARSPIYVTTVVGIPPMEDFYLGKASERVFLPLIRKTRARDRRHALSGGRHLPQHRARLDRQALPGPRAQDHERVLGTRPAHVLQVHRRRRQGRERAGRSGGRVDRRHARRSVARHRRS